MKKFILLGLLFLGSIVSALASNHKDQALKMDFKEFVSNISLNESTILHVQQFWNDNKEKSVTWKAQVINVVGVKGKAEIKAANASAALYKGFNLVLVSSHRPEAAKLQIGQEIKFKGNVFKYRNRSGAIIVYVKNVVVLPQ